MVTQLSDMNMALSMESECIHSMLAVQRSVGLKFKDALYQTKLNNLVSAIHEFVCKNSNLRFELSIHQKQTTHYLPARLCIIAVPQCRFPAAPLAGAGCA